MARQRFKQSAPPKGYYTYAYLREDGRPWYVGKGVGRRAWRPHGGKRKWLPPAEEHVLVLKWGMTNDQALRHERYLIAVLGREIDGGMLAANRSLGGEAGALGVKQSLESLAQKSSVARNLKRYGVTAEEWLAKSQSERNGFVSYHRANPSVGFHAYFAGVRTQRPVNQSRIERMKQTKAEKTSSQYGLDVRVWQALDRNKQLALMAWVSSHPGKTGADYLEQSFDVSTTAAREARFAVGARKYGVELNAWKSYSAATRKTVGKRFARGKRGEALLEGLI